MSEDPRKRTLKERFHERETRGVGKKKANVLFLPLLFCIGLSFLAGVGKEAQAVQCTPDTPEALPITINREEELEFRNARDLRIKCLLSSPGETFTGRIFRLCYRFPQGQNLKLTHQGDNTLKLPYSVLKTSFFLDNKNGSSIEERFPEEIWGSEEITNTLLSPEPSDNETFSGGVSSTISLNPESNVRAGQYTGEFYLEFSYGEGPSSAGRDNVRCSQDRKRVYIPLIVEVKSFCSFGSKDYTLAFSPRRKDQLSTTPSQTTEIDFKCTQGTRYTLKTGKSLKYNSERTYKMYRDGNKDSGFFIPYLLTWEPMDRDQLMDGGKALKGTFTSAQKDMSVTRKIIGMIKGSEIPAKVPPGKYSDSVMLTIDIHP